MLSYVIWETLTRNQIRLLSLTHLQPTMCILGLDRGTTWQKLIQLLEDAMAEWCSELPPRPSDLQGAGSSPAGNWVIFLIDVCFYVIASTVSNANADSYSFESFVLSRLNNAE